MSQHQDNQNNYVVTDKNDRIVEGPSSRAAAEQKREKLVEQGGQPLQEGLKVRQLLTE